VQVRQIQEPEAASHIATLSDVSLTVIETWFGVAVPPKLPVHWLDDTTQLTVVALAGEEANAAKRAAAATRVM
jgi:hypothetical protein